MNAFPTNASADGDFPLLIVPGLNGSGAPHWQSWLERQEPSARRIALQAWVPADLDAWVQAIADEVAAQPGRQWVAVAHSFGCLALAEYLIQGGCGIHAALMVAPAHPRRVGLERSRFNAPLPCTSVLVRSDNDPWILPEDAQALGRDWGSRNLSIGGAGHINTASGFGPWPLARQLVEQLRQPGRLPAYALPRAARASQWGSVHSW